ncbi:MAG: type II secretion system F family protein [Candidatus Micrarchaeota archaeon]
MKNTYETIGRFVPRNLLAELGASLTMAGIETSPEAFAGLSISIAAFAVAVVFFIASSTGLPGYSLIFLPALTLLVAVLSLYLLIALRIESRKAQVESVLPDFLHIAASNVRAGMPVDQALWFAARPEFGLLSQEVELVAKRTFGGESFSHTLDRLAGRFDSALLRRTVKLITHGISSGGEIAGMLEDTANDVKRVQLIRKEVTASMLMYVIFITFASIIGAPFLYAVSYKLFSVLERIWDKMSSSGPLPKVGFLVPSSPGVTPDQFLWFSVFAILITSIVASFIVSVIQTGSKREGVKYIPIFSAAGLAVFLMLTIALDVFTK